MKLLSIRLHPFGGTADRTSEFNDGLNVLEGPNEFGKSTLHSALWHALFTTANLPPMRMKNTFGRWFPKPGGDHVRVTLRFSSGNQIWTLSKTWGAGTSASLQADGQPALADANKIQDQLACLLQRNEATWEHVLFTGQAKLAATIDHLRKHAGEIDDIDNFLAGAAAIPGDVGPEKLLAAIDERISQHFSRWDRAHNAPENGRGIENPWSKQVGTLLAAYYAQETTRRDLNKVIQYENQVDEINGVIQQLSALLERDTEFIREGRGLREGLSKAEGLIEKCLRLNTEKDALMQIMSEWPGADQIIRSKEEERVRVATSLDVLSQELKHAQLRVQAEQLREGHKRIVAAKSQWQQTQQKLAACQPIDPSILLELKQLTQAIDTLRIQIAAQKLSATLESRTDLTVTLHRGTQEPEVLSISPVQPWEGEAEGRILVDVGDLRLSVQSGTGDVAGLFEDLTNSQQRLDEILGTLGLANLAEVEAASKNHETLSQAAHNEGRLYTAALQGLSEEQWAEKMLAVQALPETRDVTTLEQEQKQLLATQAQLDAEIRHERSKVEQWTSVHTDLQTLMLRIIERTAELKSAEEEVAKLPSLPNAYDSVAQYLHELSKKEQIQEQTRTECDEARRQHAHLMGIPQEHTAEELKMKLEIQSRVFAQQQGTGHALLRIRDTLATVIENRGSHDPLKGLAEAVSQHFNALTCGRYDTVAMDGTAPTSVSGSLALDASLLSQGTLGSLALATRLALANLYLDGMDGFLLLDDPFTDMDFSRREAASRAIGKFAENRQVLCFTCHPEHANGLISLGGGAKLRMS